MSTTTVRPEVAAFVETVRRHLADLSEEQRDELLEGLEADLSEQVAAGDPLPEPAAYAAELRAAAGISAPSRWAGSANLLEQARAEVLGWTERTRETRLVWELVVAVRPAWWVLRAWIAVTLIDQVSGPWEYVSLWPTLGVPLLGPLLLLAAVVVSVLIGLGRLWPGSGPERPTAARLVLVALNALAVVAPLTFSGDGSQQYAYDDDYRVGFHDAASRPGLRQGSEVVRNIYAYDAAGQPLSGVQLFDQAGRPVAVSPLSSMGQGRERQVTCPWFNGASELFNVYPLPQRTQARGTCADDSRPDGDAASQAPPFASVPPVSATRAE